MVDKPLMGSLALVVIGRTSALVDGMTRCECGCMPFPVKMALQGGSELDLADAAVSTSRGPSPQHRVSPPPPRACSQPRPGTIEHPISLLAKVLQVLRLISMALKTLGPQTVLERWRE